MHGPGASGTDSWPDTGTWRLHPRTRGVETGQRRGGDNAGELVAEELRDAQAALSEITGAFATEDLLERIFSSFCIGK